MGNGQIGFSEAGESAQPSPSIFGDCPNTLLTDKGLGYFGHEEFLGGAVSAAMLATSTVGSGILGFDGDTDTVFAMKAGELGGYLDIETDGDDNDAAAIFTEPFGSIVRNSGKKLWFEVRIEVGAIADQGVFVGLVEEAGASRDVLADNIASNGVITESLIGFVVDNGDTDAIDAIYRKDAGTVVNVLDNVTASASYVAAGGTSAALVADTEVKLGIRFDGRDKLTYYANGYKVATVDVDSTIDQVKNYCAIVAVKTGTAAAVSIASDWFRYGYQSRN